MEDATILLETLKELEQSKLEEFIWHLRFSVEKDIRIPQGDLEGAKRQDVVGYMINRFKTNAGKITVQVLCKMNQNYLATCLESKLPEGQQGTRSAPVPVESQPTQSDGKRRKMTLSSQEFKTKTLKEMADEIYRPTMSQKKGSVLLITNIKFDHLKYRDGAELDEENIKWLLTALGYSVEKHRNLSGAEIDEKVKNFATRPEHRASDSTFVVIMSHGSRINNRDAIAGVHYHKDQNPDDVYFVDETFSHLNSESCPALIDKPKVILIQACRGAHPGGVEVRDQVPESDSWDSWFHREKDFVCFMSTLPDTASYRNSATGSHFINYIVEVFCEWAHEQHIMDLFTKVSNRMETRQGRTDDKILPCLERTSLTKKFYLFPGF